MSSVGPNSRAAESSHAGLGGFAHTGAGAGTPTTAHDKIRPGDETGAESALVFEPSIFARCTSSQTPEI
jgi:hypothetical protein